jgi:hypothetical protein
VNNCTYTLGDTKTHDCNWSGCRIIFKTLFLRENKEEYINFISNGKKQLKEDKICESCFSENLDGDPNKDLCKGCDEVDGWPNFLSEEDYLGPDEEEVSNKDDRCQKCFNNNMNSDVWPCNSCGPDDDWKHFVVKEKEAEESLPNGLVELPFGIKKKTMFTYPDSRGSGEAPTFENAVYWARHSLLMTIFKDMEVKNGEEYPDAYDITRALCTDPEKYLKQLTTILQPVSPGEEK